MTNRLLLIHLCIFALLFWTAKTLQSAPASLTFTVNSTLDIVDANPGDGYCLTLSGTCTLRAAIMEANQINDATIILPAGIYTLTIPPGCGVLDGSCGALRVFTGATILGAGAAGTIVDGNGAVINDRVFDIFTAVTQTATISGITIRNGKQGGMWILGPLTLANCIVTNNTADADGAGIWLDATGFWSRPVLAMTNCTVSNNTSNGFASNGVGGGIDNYGGVLTINNSTIISNYAARGGGLSAIFSKQTVVNGGSIVGNSSGWDGGGVYVLASTTTLNGVLVDASTAITNGGGIYVYGAVTPVRVNQSTVDSNMAGGLGAGVFVREGAVTFDNSTVSYNTTTSQFDDGGGFYNSGTLTLTNSTVSGNGATGYGGGIYNSVSGTVGLFNVTIAYNLSGSEFGGFPGSNVPGGGIENNGGTVTLRNTIVATNTLETGTFDLVPNDCNGTLSSQGYNLIQTTSGCVIVGDPTSNKTGVDPNLGPLAFNGGGTQTNALSAGSPAIDAGNRAAAATATTWCSPPISAAAVVPSRPVDAATSARSNMAGGCICP